MKKKIRVTIGGEIKDLLKKKGISAYRMCQDLGIDPSYVSRVVRNQIGPSYEMIKRMVDYLGYEIRIIRKGRKGKRSINQND
jgi:transcriptional regulator with XRE-family HTH domain